MISIHTDTVNNFKFIRLQPQDIVKIMPQGFPFILLDKVQKCCVETKSMFGLKNITLSDPILSGHFREYPIYPGVLIIEALAQNSGLFIYINLLHKRFGSYADLIPVLEKGLPNNYVLVDSKVKHINPVFPGDSLLLESTLLMEREKMHIFNVSAKVDDQIVAKGQVTFAMLPDISV